MPVGYGKKVREEVRQAQRTKTASYLCPACSRTAVRRLSVGLWQCTKCQKKFASKAYEFTA